MTPPSPIQPDSPDAGEYLWRFAVAFYGRPGVAPACLALQEALSADVNLILLGLFAELERGIVLDEADLEEAAKLVQGWQQRVVKTLRSLRTELKSGPFPAPSATSGFRYAVKSLELEAERIELATLADWLGRREPAPLTEPGRDCISILAAFHAARANEPAPQQVVSDAWVTLAKTSRDWSSVARAERT